MADDDDNSKRSVFVITIHCTHHQHSAHFENSSDFLDKHDYSVISYPIIPADYTARSAHA